MRKRFNSESENSVTQVIVEEDKLYKDKAIPESYTSKFFNIIKSEISQAGNSFSNSPSSSLQQHSNQQGDDYSEPEEIIFVMTARDRSAEFSTCIRSLQGRNIDRVVNLSDPKKVKQMQNYSEFLTTAKSIGRNIASTYTKLEKLTLLAKRKSLFDDRPAEIHELTYIIKSDLSALNQQIGYLQEISRNQSRSNGKHLNSHSSNMVMALQTRLANMSTDFQQVLEVRTENLKHQKTRREQFAQAPSHSARNNNQGRLLFEQDDQVSIDMSSSSPTQPLLSANNQSQMQIYDDTDQYVQERAETMQNIESTIVELGGIFQQLAHMVKEQEEVVGRIDSNIQDVELNVEAAHSQILKYFQSVSKNRWLMIKIFGVLIFFFIFFVLFVA